MIITRLGDRALVVRHGTSDSVSKASCEKTRGLAAAVGRKPLPEQLALIPAYGRLTILFTRPFGDRELQKRSEALRKIAVALRPSKLPSAPIPVVIPVRYGGAEGPDLEEVARIHGLSPGEVIRFHTRPIYTVHQIGFVPGFPYLGGLPERLATPRLETPRARVPAGSVGIGGPQTGIYPQEGPAGWRIIGRTEVKLFDASLERPCLLAAGMTLRFEVAG